MLLSKEDSNTSELPVFGFIRYNATTGTMPGIPLDIIIFMYIDIHKKLMKTTNSPLGNVPARNLGNLGISRGIPREYATKYMLIVSNI